MIQLLEKIKAYEGSGASGDGGNGGGTTDIRIMMNGTTTTTTTAATGASAIRIDDFKGATDSRPKRHT